jgi:hypothetical protein
LNIYLQQALQFAPSGHVLHIGYSVQPNPVSCYTFLGLVFYTQIFNTCFLHNICLPLLHVFARNGGGGSAGGAGVPDGRVKGAECIF